MFSFWTMMQLPESAAWLVFLISIKILTSWQRNWCQGWHRRSDSMVVFTMAWKITQANSFRMSELSFYPPHSVHSFLLTVNTSNLLQFLRFVKVSATQQTTSRVRRLLVGKLWVVACNSQVKSFQKMLDRKLSWCSSKTLNGLSGRARASDAA